MALEVEVKFPCSDLLVLRQILKERGGQWNGEGFERNMVFDSQMKSLRGQNMLLRLRETDKNEICLKRPPCAEDTSSVCKVWEEYETQIEDVQNMRAILEGLGYFVAFQYEKYRDRWTFHSCEICLDVLPFGQFVEIEGNENTIYKSARLLGLDIREALTKSYYELNQDYRKARGLCAEDSFVFDTVKRSQLIESGLNF